LLHATGDYTAAEPLYRRALAICEASLRADHPDTALSRSKLANLEQLIKEKNKTPTSITTRSIAWLNQRHQKPKTTKFPT